MIIKFFNCVPSIFLCSLVFLPCTCRAKDAAANAANTRCQLVNAKDGLTMQQAVEEGLKANLDLMAAKYDVSSARADELTAGLWYNPSLVVDAVSQPFGSNWNQTTAGGPRQNDVVVSYPLDITGKKSKGLESAHQAAKAAEANFQDLVRRKALAIQLSCIDLMLNEQLLSLSHEKENNMQSLVELLRTRAGRKDILPLLQSRAQLALDQAVQLTKRRENALRASKVSLAALLGRKSLDDAFNVSTELCSLNIAELPGKEKLIAEAVDNRPDMQALRLNRLKAISDRKLASAMVMDNLSLGVGYTELGAVGANPDDPGSSSISGSQAWSASLGIPLPLFDRNQGNIEKAKIAMEQIDKQISALDLSIRQEITGLYDHAVLTKDIIEKYEGGQLKNAEYVRNTQQRLFGTGSQQEGLLDYFDAMGAYNDTLEGYYDTLADYWRDTVSLNAATGKDIW